MLCSQFTKIYNMEKDYLKNILKYDKNKGLFYWKNPKARNVKEGQLTGNKQKSGYITITVDSKQYLAHRLAWLYEYGVFPKNDIDHINGIRDDNRIENLRECTRQQNMYNRRLNKDSTSGVKNVHWSATSNKWRVRIRVNGKQIQLGVWDDLEFAELVAIEARIKYNGIYATDRK